MNRSLPSSFEYHGIPLPWLQIDILRVLACLGKENKKWVPYIVCDATMYYDFLLSSDVLS